MVAESFDPVKGWQKHYDRNEALDLFVLALAAGLHHSTQVHRMREMDWLRLESLYEHKGAPKSEPAMQMRPGGRRIPFASGS